MTRDDIQMTQKRLNNSPRLNMYDTTGSAENGEVDGENLHPSSVLPVCKSNDQCKCDNGAVTVLMYLFHCPI